MLGDLLQGGQAERSLGNVAPCDPPQALEESVASSQDRRLQQLPNGRTGVCRPNRSPTLEKIIERHLQLCHSPSTVVSEREQHQVVGTIQFFVLIHLDATASLRSAAKVIKSVKIVKASSFRRCGLHGKARPVLLRGWLEHKTPDTMTCHIAATRTFVQRMRCQKY